LKDGASIALINHFHAMQKDMFPIPKIGNQTAKQPLTLRLNFDMSPPKMPIILRNNQLRNFNQQNMNNTIPFIPLHE